MDRFSRAEVRKDLLRILEDVREGWDWSGEVTEDTGIFNDLGFESIDAVALGSLLEEHYNLSFPFAEFLTNAKEQNLKDISIGQLVTFLMASLDGAASRQVS